MRRSATFILSDVRSGSTLLDQRLGQHPDIVSLGEVHWLRAYALQDRGIYDPIHPLVCTCGMAIENCPFWTRVSAFLGRSLESLQLHADLTGRRHRKALPLHRRLLVRLVESFPTSYRMGVVQSALDGPVVARDTLDLLDAVASISGRPHCVDSSKSPLRFRAVYSIEPDKTRAVVLVRDYRAVIHSKMKRGRSLDAAAAGWRQKMDQIDALTRDIPSSSVHHLSYESFCTDPSSELTRLCGFLGVDYSDRMLSRTVSDSHHIGGSPSKFDKSKNEIVLDRSHEDSFQPQEIQRMRYLVGKTAKKWGYG